MELSEVRRVHDRIVVAPGAPRDPESLTDLDHVLTARWAAFRAPPSGLRHARAEHGPWPLQEARLVELDGQLLTSAGLPPPDREPIIQWSPGVEVRFGRPSRICPPLSRRRSSVWCPRWPRTALTRRNLHV